MEKENISDQFNKWILPLAMLAGVSLIWMFHLHDPEHSWLFPFLDALIWFSAHLPFFLIIAIMQRYYHSTQPLSLPNLGSVLVFASASLLIYNGITHTFSWVSPSYAGHVQEFMILRFFISVLIMLLFTMNFWVGYQRKNEERIKAFAIEKERESIRIELNTLQQQFKPHFLFNSLNSINALTLTNPEEARRMVHMLSEFMRAAVRQNQSELIPLSQEIHHIRLYTDIEKVRFGDRLQVEFEIPEDTQNLLLPSLILQPLMENAVKYGLYGHTETVSISIAAYTADRELRIVLSNPYDEETETRPLGTGFGLTSVEKKMLILYQRPNLVRVERSNGIFTVTLLIPQS